MTEEEFKQKEAGIPTEYADKFGYGLYGGIVQYYIKGVDGTIAQLGNNLPSVNRLDAIYSKAKKEHDFLIEQVFGR